MEEKDTAEAREHPLPRDDLCLTHLLAGCLLKCSGHGHCDPITKRCICSQLWMENLIQRYIRDGESNCGESWRGGWAPGEEASDKSFWTVRKSCLTVQAINSTLFSSKAHWTSSRGDGSKIFLQFTLGLCLRHFLKPSCWGNSPRQSRCC